MPDHPGRDVATALERRRLLGAAAILGLLVLLAGVAVAAGGGRPVAGERASIDLPQALVDYAFSVLVVLAVAVLLVILVAMTQVRRSGEPRSTGRGRVLVGGFVLLFALLGLSRLIREPGQRPLFEPAPLGGELRPGRDPDAAGQARRERPEFRWEVALLAVAGVAAALALALRRRELGDEAGEDAAGAVSAVLDEALDDLRAERDARRAVIAAYARLEATLARHGLPRRPAEAPLEYLSRILLELEVAPTAVLDLTELFEQAKFSRRRIDTAMKDEAIDALVAVRDDLRAAA